MLQLAFMRHGEAEQVISNSDFERKMTDRGQQIVQQQSYRFANLQFDYQLILASSSQRTLETGQIMERALKETPLIASKKLYLAGFQTFYEVLVEHASDRNSLLLIGHNPGWSEIVSLLTGVSVAMQPADIHICTYDGDEPLHLAATNLAAWDLASSLLA